MRFDAENVHYRDLNGQVHDMLAGGGEITIDNVLGHRYLGVGLGKAARVVLNGVPGNDLGVFLNGAEIVVNDNSQDGVGNTMNAGRIVIHGDAGDVLGHSMRGGSIFVRGSVGYRAGIHMKAYRSQTPVIVVGGTAGDYLGEYMAGGVLVVLGLCGHDGSPVGDYLGTGMHGGVIYLRGKADSYQLGREVVASELSEEDWECLSVLLSEYGALFGDASVAGLQRGEFRKYTPYTTRPYGRLYAY